MHMDRGTDFLKAQIANSVMQHRTFVENLVDHEKQAEDERFRALCASFIPKASAHQQMLEDYAQEIGAVEGAAKKMLGKALGMARDLADAARESDFLRLVGDIVTARQSEDTFKTFREAGRSLGIERLAQIGEHGERDHDDYGKQANHLCQQLFIEYVRQGDTAGLNISSTTSTSSSTSSGMSSGTSGGMTGGTSTGGSTSSGAL
jgi:cell division septum initiation protein DivIVA